MTKEQTFNKEIMKIASDVLESGELEAVLRNKVLDAFSEAFGRAISWGNVRDAIMNRVEEVHGRIRNQVGRDPQRDP